MFWLLLFLYAWLIFELDLDSPSFERTRWLIFFELPKSVLMKKVSIFFGVNYFELIA